MRRKIYLAFAAFSFLWYGGQRLYTALANWTPTKIAMADYGKAKPKHEWLELTGCTLAIEQAMHAERHGQVDELYIPVFADDDEKQEKIEILLASKDPVLKKLYAELGAQKDEQLAIKLLLSHKSQLWGQTVKGVVRFGIELKDSDRKKLASLDNTLAPDFIIVDATNQPSLVGGLWPTAVGLLLAALFLRSLRKRPAYKPPLTGQSIAA
jgi:hypothetical protein